MMYRLVTMLLSWTFVAGCGDASGFRTTEFEFQLPEGIPLPDVPEDNPMTVEKVELGRFLFYDQRLSANQTQSCGTCHQQDRAFTDGLARAVGSTGQMHPRGAMSVANAAYQATLTWANKAVVLLEKQALVPMFGEDPIELGLTTEEQLIERLRVDERYPEMFAAAYPDETEPITLGNVTKSIAAFQRSITSFNSRYDKFLAGELELTESELVGAALFAGGTSEAGVVDAIQCFHCHGGFLFSQSTDNAQFEFTLGAFFNNGLYNLDQDGAYPPSNPGLAAETGLTSDNGKFKPPTLRNIALTAPYMHDGSIATLEEVVDHYVRGGRLIETGPHAGDGKDNPNKDGLVSGFTLSERERTGLLDFLRALTDESLCTNPAYSDPFAAVPPAGCMFLETN